MLMNNDVLIKIGASIVATLYVVIGGIILYPVTLYHLVCAALEHIWYEHPGA